MSLWWVQREQLDTSQRDLIEQLPLAKSALILGSPGSGKTNVLLRRAQFVRSQGISNIMLLTFTRPLAEFVKTGCFDSEGREFFPKNLVNTLESWQRSLFKYHEQDLPDEQEDLTSWKRLMASTASGFRENARLPKYDTIFVDEAQDLLDEEVELIKAWSNTTVFVGDDRQRIYDKTTGLKSVRDHYQQLQVYTLPFHYRLAPEICRVADKIMVPVGGGSLESTCHYAGPRPATVAMTGLLPREEQVRIVIAKLKEQIRVYSDLIDRGDRLGVITSRRNDRDYIHAAIEEDPDLSGKSKIIRSKTGPEDAYDPSFDSECPICVLTTKSCKGLEFRAIHWIFADELSWSHMPEDYYTSVTRAKTSLEVYSTGRLPQELSKAYSQVEEMTW